jgi:multiple sugar transport system ATP-binding protein
MSRLILEGITKRYSAFAALADVDLDVEDGEFVAILGPSGCGKSTLLRIVAGLVDQTSGRVVIGQRDVSLLPPARRGIAMVFQSYALYPHLTVEGNLTLGLRQAGTPKPLIAERVAEAARILELGPLLKRRPAQLSGGQRQRVAIGRAIVRHPEVFLFDEPLSNLDALLRTQVRTEISDLHRRLGATMLYVTHDQHEAMTLAHRIVVLNEGAVQQIGTPADLYRRPATVFVAGFIGSPRINMLDGQLDNGTVTVAGMGRIACGASGARKVIVGIRPTGLRIGEAQSAGIAGTLIASEYVGSDSFLRIRLSSDDIITVHEHPDHPWRAEQELALSVRPASVHLFDAATGQRIGDAVAEENNITAGEHDRL